jgi:energy-coupling factor transporter ATP-binding protein EcfA2
MDFFIKITNQKKIDQKTTIHTKQLKALETCLRDGTNVFVCGPTGVGKTHLVSMLVNEQNSIELALEDVSSKSVFLDVIRGTSKHILIENYESSQYGFKSLIDRVSDGKDVTKGSLVVVTNDVCLGYPNFETIILPPPTIDQLVSIKSTPGAEAAANASRGDIRVYLHALQNHGQKDHFKTPKEFIADVLCSNEPMGFQETLSEHGNIWNIFQENYVNSKGVNIERCAHSFSDADLYDAAIYNGWWELMPYFSLHAVTIPHVHLGKKLDRDKLRPGSCWTKYGNYKMRSQKYRDIHNRTGQDIESLCLLKKHAEYGNTKILVDYGITPQDFDVMNHLAISSKLKAKHVTHVKKALKHAIDRKSV